MTLTALVLIESTAISCKHKAVSACRDSLIDFASTRYLHRSMTPLRDPNGKVEIGDTIGTVLTIEEVEFV